ncbi:hypothetical protein CSOJ01_11230 [Colletotrichum sojae]|uniref:Uncharacterized protein n=1 Tax=Colletotrichum sojae TaxID=2175907 RepID=A0A8H6IYX6_9PEZI|nr:hypothetical protein CSOJ01_11230 [Colletotrichum sojae]
MSLAAAGDPPAVASPALGPTCASIRVSVGREHRRSAVLARMSLQNQRDVIDAVHIAPTIVHMRRSKAIFQSQESSRATKKALHRVENQTYKVRYPASSRLPFGISANHPSILPFFHIVMGHGRSRRRSPSPVPSTS